jgi:phage head maturation protease
MTESIKRRILGLDGFRELIRSVKDPASINTAEIEVIAKMGSEVKALGGDDSRLIEFVITSDRVDRDQDILNPDGWDFDDYLKNPVVLWCHDHYALPVGNAKSLTRQGNKWKSICEFVPKEINPFAYMTYQMYAKGFMHAVSVGFMPIAYTMAADRKYGVNYEKQGLLEYSTVPVPSNPDALVQARSKGIDIRPLYDWAEKVLDEKSGLDDEARHRTEVLRAVSAPSGRALILDMGDKKMNETEKKEPPTPTTTVKKVDRWDCGEKSHSHDSEAEASACASFDVAVTDATKSLQQLQSLVKSGRTIRPEAKALLRTIVGELAPEEKKVEEKKDEVEDKGGSHGGFAITEEALRAAVTDGVTEKFNELTGRVD